MPPQIEELIPTRATLLERLKNWQDQASWQEFFKTYEKLIFGVALKSGLTEAEAKDVVQETMMVVGKKISDFVYDPAVCSFKTWLLNMVRWRVTDQLRKRGPNYGRSFVSIVDEAPNTQTTGEMVDPASSKLDALWNDEWERNILEAAVANVKRSLEPEKYQLFDFYVNKGWSPEKVAHCFGVSLNLVYVSKHRVTGLIKEEVERLRKEVI